MDTWLADTSCEGAASFWEYGPKTPAVESSSQTPLPGSGVQFAVCTRCVGRSASVARPWQASATAVPLRRRWAQPGIVCALVVARPRQDGRGVPRACSWTAHVSQVPVPPRCQFLLRILSFSANAELARRSTWQSADPSQPVTSQPSPQVSKFQVQA